VRVAVFSDIHSNIHALEAVLEDISTQEADRIICLGDLVGYGAYPNEVIRAIRENSVPTIMGNYDDGVGHERGDCGCAYRTKADKERGRESIVWTVKKVTEENKAFLRQLASHVDINANGVTARFVHGSPRRVNEYLFEDRPLSTLERVLDLAGTDVLVCGHTHLPYHRTVGARHIVNDGSVGKPKHGNPKACYALLDLKENLGVEFRFVEYDFEAAAMAVESVGLPREFADALRVGTG
jgi:putative phosphoesterase